MDRALLEYILKKKGYNFTNMAEVLGIKKPSMSYRLNGKVQFSREEIITVAKWLELTEQEVIDVFFCDMKVN